MELWGIVTPSGFKLNVIIMNKNEITTIDQLANGDRFYFLADKSKTVWQKVERKAKKTEYQTYRYWALQASLVDTVMQHSSIYFSNCIKAVNRETKIVYLRSTGIQITNTKS